MRRRRSRHLESEGQERWLVSYADFITLMFAFFTVLYATSEKDMEKTKQFQKSVRQFLVKAGAFGGSGEKVDQGEKYNSPIEPPIKTFKQTPVASVELQTKVIALVESGLSQEQLDKLLIDVSEDDYGVHVVLSADFLFEPNSKKLRATAEAELKHLVSLISALENRVIVEGHSGSSMELSSDRANEMIRYLTSRGVDSRRLASMSFGEQRPLSRDKENKHLNERIVLRILSDDSPF